jgi:hypothetical protein
MMYYLIQYEYDMYISYLMLNLVLDLMINLVQLFHKDNQDIQELEHILLDYLKSRS